MNLRMRNGFTLIELLIVIAILAVLMSILAPALSIARSQARCVLCKSNQRQLVMANLGYADENQERFVPAAADMWDNAGKQRWHGERDSLDEPFDPLRSPLRNYLSDGRVKECPQRVDFIRGQDWDTNFEQGCGGYGYNMLYLGSRLWQTEITSVQAYQAAYRQSSRITDIAWPDQTLMFADCAMARQENDVTYYLEYSFAEPPFTLYQGEPLTSIYMSPSIHFRHRLQANVGWADGRVDGQTMAPCDQTNAYGIQSSEMKLGWFDPLDNSPFDLN